MHFNVILRCLADGTSQAPDCVQTQNYAKRETAKVEMRKQWNEWMLLEDKPLIATGNLKWLSLPTCCRMGEKSMGQHPIDNYAEIISEMRHCK